MIGHLFSSFLQSKFKGKESGVKMNAYIWLTMAILFEVFGSSMLKVSNGFKRLVPAIGVIVGMGFAFYCLSIALKTLPLGNAYAIWAGLGTALITLVGVVFWREKLNLKKVAGLICIITGVVLLRLATPGH
ncbi:quaternary ammonium determinant C [Oceanobacillus picturae]|uniref:Quaternary ammonium determinant C n=1 Tax=Oceanobacillus picturae TaxID=171693 RepID=A0A0U9HAS5_9BACI|nr:quaternary ammonium determinant C [Oceanobacillus picturae]